MKDSIITSICKRPPRQSLHSKYIFFIKMCTFIESRKGKCQNYSQRPRKGRGAPSWTRAKESDAKGSRRKKETHKTAESEGQTTKLLNAKPTPWQHKSSTNEREDNLFLSIQSFPVGFTSQFDNSSVGNLFFFFFFTKLFWFLKKWKAGPRSRVLYLWIQFYNDKKK